VKIAIIFPLLFILISCSPIATETNILFDKYEIPDQVSKDYYIKDSVSKVSKETPHIFKVDTYRTVTSHDGSTIYKSKFHIDCRNAQYLVIEMWSSGFGYDKSLVDGKWRPSSEWPDTKALTKAICSKYWKRI
jgi:hypothetical protein